MENADVIRAAIEAFNAGELEAMLATCSADYEWRPAFGAAPAGGTAYHGHDGYKRYWRDALQIRDHFHFEPERFRERADQVVVIGRAGGRGRGSGIEIDQPFAMRFVLRDGKAIFGQTYLDPAAALRDARCAAIEE